MSLASRLNDPDLLRNQAFVAGRWISNANQEVFPVKNPATGETLCSLPLMGTSQTAEAIEAAHDSWPAWRALPNVERAKLLENWHRLILENAEDLALIMTSEQGKPLAEARSEVMYGASFVKWFAEEARRIGGDVIPAPSSDRRILVLKEPVGVSAAITPWNFPNAMITRKCAPAFAAGCPIIVKPSDLTPLSALALAKLAERAGFPRGIFSVLTGMPDAIGQALTSSPLVRKLSFTGSTRVGQLLMSQSAGTIKRLSLELGGNAPFIVFDDADLELAIEGVMASKFRNAGQTCVCANRILVQGGIHDRFVERLEAAVADLVVGDGMQSNVTIGPLINQAAVDKVHRHVTDARNKGAVRIIGEATAWTGNFVPPTILTGATTDMLLASEETFGPVAPIFRFNDEAAALAIANNTPYGLASYFYTQDIRRAWRVAERLEFGMVGLNTGSLAIDAAPFGGIKQSGLGREGSRLGIDEYLEIKAFHIGGLDASAG
ncbi:MAG: NAD-dependent succinate-semialdehyde dehydrogenase [Beijerinckiaceae bacterium]